MKFAEDTKCYKDIRGGNPGLLDSQTNVGKNMVEGICIAGGSNPGLATAAVIADDTNAIEGVAIYSRNLIREDESKYFVPDERLAKFALKNLSNVLYSGQVGAGCSAAKGQGVAFGKVDGYKVLAIVVCNSWGDIYPDGIVPAPKQKTSEVKLGKRKLNTTITIIVTELDLDEYWLKQLVHQVHDSMSVFIRPFHTMLDGDVCYGLSTGKRKNNQFVNNMTKLTHFFEGISALVANAIRASNHPQMEMDQKV